MFSSKRRVGGLVSLLTLATPLATLLTSCASPVAGLTNSGAVAPLTGTIRTITAVTSVSGTGSTMALQSVAVNWPASGTVGTVAVKRGDHVTAGEVLMTINPQSAGANLVQAQSDLATAQKALNDLLHPAALTIANAQQAVANDQNALDKAQENLKTAQNNRYLGDAGIGP